MRTKNIKAKIKEYFFNNPTAKLRVRQIEREIGVALPSAIRYASELEKEDILQSSKIANIKVFSANRNSQAFLFEKKFHNLKKIYDCNLIDFLINEFGNPTIIIFGSYSRGEDIETSDIDIYIESTSKQKKNLEKFEKNLKKKIQLFVHKNIKEVPNPHLANNIINGVKLNGFLEVFK